MDTNEARGVLWQKCWVSAVKKSEAYTCPMTQFVNLISGKWAIPILYRLIVINTPVRFGDLLRAAAPITQKELTKQLRLFEQRGLVTRTVYPRSRRAWSIRLPGWG